ncbi:hypothetical protein [Sphingomonas sp. CROZ-RG-20F-R02-07]|uniref:hypothetical protein n=1 Tax=Sphingomonas sp. CROZ-RG-20F-R02-07 TaxID=2914832 RepID=UPI001F59B0F8|nr:hypothetical protein [Sphingomonas sp. CROZ-RG-20F-R02-07]
MTAGDLQDILVTKLVREAGRTRRHWRLVVGPVRVHDRATHAHCNWSIAPSGDAYENDAVERIVDDLRLDHPFIEKFS